MIGTRKTVIFYMTIIMYILSIIFFIYGLVTLTLTIGIIVNGYGIINVINNIMKGIFFMDLFIMYNITSFKTLYDTFGV